jgi:uncharacterized membrane protein
MNLFKLVILGVLLIGLSACCFGGGHETTIVPANSGTTLGRELQDLEEAYKKGAISKDEYERARKKIIDQRTNQ